MRRFAAFLAALCPLSAMAMAPDPGIAGLIFTVIAIAPLLVLVGIGAVFGKARGALIGTLLYAVGFSALYVKGRYDMAVQAQATEVREKAIAVCTSELAAVRDAYPVDGLLVESGIVKQSTLTSLLGGQGLKFVELKARPIPADKKEASHWGVDIVSGSTEGHHFMPPSAAYVRYSLGLNGDPLCDERMTGELNLNRPNAPFSPDACVRVESASASIAPYALKFVNAAGAELARWALVSQATGQIVVALTTGDAPTSPVQQGTDNARELKPVRFGNLSCREPHFSLMLALYHSQAQVPGRLTLNRRVVKPNPADIATVDNNLPDVLVEEHQIFDGVRGKGDDRLTHEWDEDWAKAFQAAKQNRWADVGSSLIDDQMGELLSLDHLTNRGQWQRAEQAASKKGFIALATVMRHGTREVLLLRYALDGTLQWQGVMRSASPVAGLSALDPIGVTWRQGEIHVFGFKQAASGKTETWVAVIPEASVGVVD